MEEIKQECIKLMKNTNAAYLSTIGSDGFPHTRMMANLRHKTEFPNLTEVFASHDQDFLIYLTTSKSSLKMQQIQADPNVSVYYCNPGEFHGMMLAGKAEIIDDKEIKNQLWQDGWDVYWPAGPEGPEFTVLRILPTLARGWFKTEPFEFTILR